MRLGFFVLCCFVLETYVPSAQCIFPCIYIYIALIRLLDKCTFFVYLKSNGMFPLERFLNLSSVFHKKNRKSSMLVTFCLKYSFLTSWLFFLFSHHLPLAPPLWTFDLRFGHLVLDFYGGCMGGGLSTLPALVWYPSV